ncbi:MAG TPA: hypothetical protein VGR70_12265 [Stellaceae bacterium]|nr:hypothetical protein [Stellaceae bacterium]
MLREIRSPVQALADLVTKVDTASPDHPHRPMWERMIRQLATEIELRRAA